MKSLLILSLLSFLVSIETKAQSVPMMGGVKKPPSGATTPASSTAPGAAAGGSSAAATAGNQQSGYVYRLRFHYLIKYGTSIDTTYSIPRKKGDTDYTKSIHKTHTMRDTVVKVPKKTAKKASAKLKRKGKQTDKTLSDSCCRVIHQIPEPDISVQTCGASPCSTADSLYSQTDIIVDSISRYWAKPRGRVRIFQRNRLRVSVTQADSGKLKLDLLDNDFNYEHLDPAPEGIIKVKLSSGRSKSDTSIDFAKPISADDSADAFYLQIHNRLKAGDPLYHIVLPYAMTQFGAMTVPFKYRPAPKNSKISQKAPTLPQDSIISTPSESSAGLSLALYVGRRWGWTSFYFNSANTYNTLSFMVSGFLGASLVPLAATNVAYPHTTDSLPASVIAFSFGAAATLEWRGIDLGLFSGLDIATNSVHWVYNKKLWFGFGIGINLSMFTSGNKQFQLGGQ